MRNCNLNASQRQQNPDRISIDLDLKTVGGETALFKAVQNLKIDCASILLQCGADATIESNDGQSIFQLADLYDNPQLNHVLD